MSTSSSRRLGSGSAKAAYGMVVVVDSTRGAALEAFEREVVGFQATNLPASSGVPESSPPLDIPESGTTEAAATSRTPASTTWFLLGFGRHLNACSAFLRRS